MKKYHRQILNKYSLIVLVIILVLIIPGNHFHSSNSIIEKVFYQLEGSRPANDDIVLINIDKNDIDKLGWPLKRNYYALLLNRLSKIKTGPIYFEMFFAKNQTFQSVYNELLAGEISKNKHIVLSSLAEGITFKGDDEITGADSILKPQFAELKNVKVAHLNYIENNERIIPLKIKSGQEILPAFSKLIADGIKNENKINTLHLNLNRSWKEFKRYSLIQFLDLVDKNDSSLNSLQNKSIIIGVSDPQIAKTISTPFDENLPGIGLHAIAANNLIGNEELNDSWEDVSGVIFFIIFVFTLFIPRRQSIILKLILLGVLIVISFYLFTGMNLQLNNSALILLTFVLLGNDFIQIYLDKNKSLRESHNEALVLGKALKAKEQKLADLQKIIERKSDSQDVEIEISKLKSQVEQLKNIEEGNKPFQFQPGDVKKFHGIVYRSKAMAEVEKLIEKTAHTDVNILLLGESGTGKELAAEALHNFSGRKGNFAAVNCAAVPEALLESELFGHAKGAFTNAVSDKIGKFEFAENGTIFLDEIGETDDKFQAKLLRVLQSGEYDKIGSPVTRKTNARVIAATNKDLNKLVKEKKFREDLYYRLNVIQIKLPALSERTEDIEVLAEHFVKNENSEIKISKVVMERLVEFKWKGNVRELQSVIKRAVIFASSENRSIIKLGDLPEEVRKSDASGIENLILDSLREKEFSYSSINETASELGNLSRTIVSENFRGICFKSYAENNFNMKIAVEQIAGNSKNSFERVNSKLTKYLSNIEKDVNKLEGKSFEEIKSQFTSKYKNLPQKYHSALDEIIKSIINKLSDI